MRRSSGCRIVSIVSPLGTVLETPCSSIMKLAAASTIGLSTFQTVSATIAAPSMLGWMPSPWFSAGIARDLVQQERQQRDLVLPGEIAIHLPERYGVFRAEVRRRFHAREQDGDALLLRALDDRGEVLLHLRRPAGREARRWRRAPESRMRTSPWLERPVDPLEPGRRGVARDPGVDDLPLVAVGVAASPAAAPDTPAASSRPSPALRLSPSTTIFGRPGVVRIRRSGRAPARLRRRAACLPAVCGLRLHAGEQQQRQPPGPARVGRTKLHVSLL